MKISKRTLVMALVTMTSLAAISCGGGTGKATQDAEKGPHGGKLLSKGSFALEVQIFEEGVPPEYRLYGFDGGKPLDPKEFSATIVLKRLERTDTINFTPRGDYLLGDKEVVEPHSFDVTVKATRDGNAYDWTFSSYEGRTEIKPEELKGAGVEIERVGPMRMKSIIELPGQIALNADKTAHVVPRLRGVVTEVRKNLGDQVTRGEVLAVIDSGDLATAKQAHIASMHRLELARISAEREEALWKKKISSEEDYLITKHAFEEARITYQASTQKLAALGITAAEIESLTTGTGNLARYELRSPLTGTVIEKHVSAGEAVEGTETIFNVADLSTVWTEITVAPNHLVSVRSGQPVVVHWEDQDIEVPGTVTYVGSVLGEESRSARARVVISNPDGMWKPGLFVTVHLSESETDVPMAVKASALQTFRDWDVVFVKVGDLFEARPLELGRREGEWVEVLGGLTPGQEYATTNSFVVKADVMKSGASHDH